MSYVFYFTLLVFCIKSQNVIPEWNCWYHTYENNVRVVNLLFSYNNPDVADVIISSSSPQNELTPSNLNGQQPDIFKAGYNAYVMSLNHVPVSWQLGTTRIDVSEVDLTPEQRCSAKFLGTCPLWIPHFCEDSVYCNGEESCFSVAIFGVLTSHSFGSCSRPASGVNCGVTAQCNESLMTCVSLLPPETPAPTPPPVYPLFDCWYYTTTETKMVVNLRMSYNNTSPNSVTRPLENNKITPNAYDGVQPTLFYGGVNIDAFVISDTLDMLTTDQIMWRIGDVALTLTSENVTVATRCAVESPQDTPLTNAPTTEATVAPTAPAVATQCSSGGDDCSQFDSFCYGPTHCDVSLGLCVLNNPVYSPCPPAIVPATQIICVNHLSICVASMNCTVDSECNDGLLCNGKEYCVNGSCVVQTNLTIDQLCGGPNYVCIEGVGCQSTDQPISNSLLLTIIGGVALFILVIGGMLIFYFRSKKQKKKNSRSR
jgi:hypothetical protein